VAVYQVQWLCRWHWMW